MHVNGFDSSEGVVLPARRARFSSCPFHVAIWDTLRSKTSFCVTGAGHRTLFHPCGRRGTFSALPKRWHAWVKMRGAFGRRFKGRRPRFVKLSSFLIFGHDDDSVWQVRHFGLRMPRTHFSWQAQYLVDLGKEVAET